MFCLLFTQILRVQRERESLRVQSSLIVNSKATKNCFRESASFEAVQTDKLKKICLNLEYEDQKA